MENQMSVTQVEAPEDAYTDEDMAAVGRSLMETIRINCPKWAPLQDPAEIVVDLLNEIYDLKVVAVRWYLATMNDGLFIINRPPRPDTDCGPGDVADPPTLVIPLGDLPIERATTIVTAHNLAFAD
jgi:hypothetical protein